jgi:hypothetical protein
MSRIVKYLSRRGVHAIDSSLVQSRQFADDQKCETCSQVLATHVCGTGISETFLCEPDTRKWYSNLKNKDILTYYALTRSEDCYLDIPGRISSITREGMHEMLSGILEVDGIIETCCDLKHSNFPPFFLKISVETCGEGIKILGISLVRSDKDDVLANFLWKQHRLLVHFGKVEDGMNRLVGFMDIEIPVIKELFFAPLPGVPSAICFA